MITYIFIAGSVALLGRMSSIRGLRALWWVLAPTLLVTFSAIRYGIGSDYFLYDSFFTQISHYSLSDALGQFPVERGFSALMYLTHRVTDDVHIFFGICAALTVIPVLIGIRRVSSRPTLSLFLYVALAYYPASFNSVRQSIAASLLFLAETYRYERRWAWLLLSTAAVFFHTSAAIVVFALLIAQFWRTTPWRAISAIGGAFILGTVLFRFGWVVSLLGSLNERYAGYLATAAGAKFGTLLLLLAHIALITLCLALREKRVVERDANDRYLTFYVISAIVLAMALTNWLAGRFETYFGLYAILAVPAALSGQRHENALRGAVIGFALVYLMVHVSFYNGLVPYRTFFGIEGQ